MKEYFCHARGDDVQLAHSGGRQDNWWSNTNDVEAKWRVQQQLNKHWLHAGTDITVSQ